MDTYRMPEANGTQPLATEHLNLRPFKSRDAEALSEIMSDDVTMRFFASPEFDIGAAERDISQARARYRDGEFFRWCIADLADTCSGTIDAALDAASSCAEVAYAISPAARGNGYASEALSAVISYLHGECKVHRITAQIDSANTASVKTAERAGMELEGIHRDARIDRSGNYCDVAVFAHIEEA